MSGDLPAIDLNCDLGEGADHDADLLSLVSSANVCCGRHAGSDDLSAVTVRRAVSRGVAVGAHPGHADRSHFGRRELPLTATAAATLVDEQVAMLAAQAGPALHHVKLHGGLYHQVGRDAGLAEAVAAMLADRWPQLVVYAAAGSTFAAVARGRGLAVAAEAFPDRGYRRDGTLVPRGEPGAIVEDPTEAATRAVRLAADGIVRTVDGIEISLPTETLCIHGDAPGAVDVARAIRAALEAADIAVCAATGRARSS
ncbi:MAG: 5-oxoprolinase subunit PxpA [Planctomycetaceae bacterium]